jgi:hypothetical protein
MFRNVIAVSCTSLLLTLAQFLGCGGPVDPGDDTDSTPPVITNIAVTDVTTSSAAVTWETDEAATSQVEYGTTAELGQESDLDTELVTSHSVTLDGLDEDTTYDFVVSSEDAAGNEATSDQQNFTTATDDGVPPEISDVVAIDITSDGATITWTTDEDSTSQVDYGTTEAYGSSSILDSTLVQAHSVILTDLDSDTLYHYQVRSQDAAGNEATSEDKTLTTTPGEEPPETNVHIQNVDLASNPEVATIANSGAASVDMTGWRLVSTLGNQQYNFPDSFELGAGATVQVVSGGNATDNPPTQLLWTKGYIWNNDGDPAELYDATDTLVSTYP